jgi:hypothetical protein
VATSDLPEPDSIPSDEAPDPARLRLRDVLADRVGGIDDLVWYLDRALPDFSRDAEARVAVEELVDHVGRRLGFATGHDEPLGCSVWSSPGGDRLAVIVEQARDARVRLAPLLRALDALLASLPVASSRQVTALCVLCGEGNAADAEAAVTVRRAGDRCRLATLDALVKLARIVEAGRATHDDALLALRPARALADAFIDAIERGTRAWEGQEP